MQSNITARADCDVGIKTENDSAVLYVKDTGTGIQPENWKNIFAPFVREDKSRSRAMGGAGLGLALVRDIARQHKGSVQIAQSSETGTEVVLTLPIKKQSGQINHSKESSIL